MYTIDESAITGIKGKSFRDLLERKRETFDLVVTLPVEYEAEIKTFINSVGRKYMAEKIIEICRGAVAK